LVEGIFVYTGRLLQPWNSPSPTYRRQAMKALGLGMTLWVFG